MTQVFCTLKQAADRLETTEAEIEMMLDRGILRESRDGSRRLLKVADLARAAIAVHPLVGNVSPETGSPQVESDKEALTLSEPEITLPPMATVTTTKVSPRRRGLSGRAPRRVAKPTGQRHVAPDVRTREPVAARRRSSPARAVVISPSAAQPWPRRETYEMSLHQWLWMGLVDDNPLAIFIIFGIILLGAVVVAGTACLLAQVL